MLRSDLPVCHFEEVGSKHHQPIISQHFLLHRVVSFLPSVGCCHFFLFMIQLDHPHPAKGRQASSGPANKYHRYKQVASKKQIIPFLITYAQLVAIIFFVLIFFTEATSKQRPPTTTLRSARLNPSGSRSNPLEGDILVKKRSGPP